MDVTKLAKSAGKKKSTIFLKERRKRSKAESKEVTSGRSPKPGEKFWPQCWQYHHLVEGSFSLTKKRDTVLACRTSVYLFRGI
jgi:hypothetical protein